MNANQEYTIIGAGGSDQTTTMPTPSAENLGTIVQYIGDTNQYYTNGYFYKVVSNGEVPPTYSREQVDTQPASSGEEHEVITQAAYDQLTPAQKAEKVYMIKEIGTPSTVLTAGAGIDITNDEISADMSTAVYDNTTSGATATNVQDAIDEVFQSVSNGKELLADAITDKGVQTSASDSFSTMASNIDSLEIATEDMIISYNILSNSNGALIWTATATQTFDWINTMPILYTDDFSVYMVGFYVSGSGSEYYRSGNRLYKINKDGTYTYDNNLTISRDVASGRGFETYKKYSGTNASFIWYKDSNDENVIFCCKERQTTNDNTRPTRYKLVKLLKYNLITGVFSSGNNEDATEEYAYWSDLTNPPETYNSSHTSVIIPEVTVNAVGSDSLNMFLSI